MVRGAWIGAATRDNPLASSVITTTDANYLYNHETGHDDDGSAMTAYIESGDLELSDGEVFTFIKRIIPDFKFSGSSGEASLDITLKGSNFPLEDASTLSTSTITNSSTQAFVRTRARHSIVRLESTGAGYGWRLGDLRLDMRTDGRR